MYKCSVSECQHEMPDEKQRRPQIPLCINSDKLMSVMKWYKCKCSVDYVCCTIHTRHLFFYTAIKRASAKLHTKTSSSHFSFKMWNCNFTFLDLYYCFLSITCLLIMSECIAIPLILQDVNFPTVELILDDLIAVIAWRHRKHQQNKE